jgi:hypothetical protein
VIRRSLKRGRRAAKRLDLSDLKHALRDQRVWCSVGTVIKPDGAAQHYTLITAAGGELADITVDVELQPSLADVTCRLAGGLGTAGAGIWSIPSVGDEVLVMIPEGEVAFMPSIVAILSSRSIPNGGSQGPATDRTIIVNQKVLVHDGAGGAAPLPTLDEVTAITSFLSDLVDYLTNLTLPVSGATAGPPPPAPPIPSAPSAPTGTTVLEAK